jgi:hypothetical protein
MTTPDHIVRYEVHTLDGIVRPVENDFGMTPDAMARHYRGKLVRTIYTRTSEEVEVDYSPKRRPSLREMSDASFLALCINEADGRVGDHYLTRFEMDEVRQRLVNKVMNSEGPETFAHQLITEMDRRLKVIDRTDRILTDF